MAKEKKLKEVDANSECKRRRRDPTKGLSVDTPMSASEELASIFDEICWEYGDEPDPFSPNDQLIFDWLVQRLRRNLDLDEALPRPSGLQGIREQIQRHVEELQEAARDPSSPDFEHVAIVIGSLNRIKHALTVLERGNDDVLASVLASVIANSINIGVNAALVVYGKEIGDGKAAQITRAKAGGLSAAVPEAKQRRIAKDVRDRLEQVKSLLDATTKAAEKVTDKKGKLIDPKTAENYYRKFYPDLTQGTGDLRLPPRAFMPDGLFGSMLRALRKAQDGASAIDSAGPDEVTAVASSSH